MALVVAACSPAAAPSPTAAPAKPTTPPAAAAPTSAPAPAAQPPAAPSAAAAAKPTAAPAAAAAPAKLSIMVGGMDKQIYLPHKLTEALGYFKEEKLDVTLIDEPSGVSSETALVAGQVEFGSGSYDHTIDLQAAGKGITSVVQLLQEPGEWVMVSKQKAGSIKSPADWLGVSAGVTSLGSGTHTLMRAMAIKAGLQVSDINFVQAGAGDTFIAAMKQGRIDVGITSQPTVLRLQTTGDGQVLVDLSKPDTTRAALGGDYPFISLWGRSDWIASNKDTTQHVVNAYVKTMKYINTHSPQEIADKLPADYQASDPAGYVKALTDSMGMFTKDGRMPQGGPEFVLKTLSGFNAELASKNIDLSKTWDPTFVESANK
ncbi:MAG: ABC transporter substrate-binding protein [Chloroflexota bacterium]